MNILRSKKIIKYKNKDIKYLFNKDNLIVENNTEKYGFLIFPNKIKKTNIKISYEGRILKGNSSELLLMDYKKNILFATTLNSDSQIENSSKLAFIVLKVAPFSKLEINKIIVTFDVNNNYFDHLKNDILVITPNYPALENKYMCAFVHSRLLEYKKAGIKFDVICCHNYNGIVEYNYEGINVLKTSFVNTRTILRNKKYKKVLIHFFDEKYANIIDASNLNDTELLLWVHGPETLYWDWPLFTTPYFEKNKKLTEEQITIFRNNDNLIKRYNNMENVKWIFVSKWIKEKSEELIGIKFNNYKIIPNIINDKIFTYKNKDENLRKKIFFIRRFDNCNKYAIDINIRTILELSKRKIFEDLEFNIYGTGDFYNELILPIKKFKNVNLYPKFLSHKEIKELHQENGIAFFPTRYDAQGVSLCEAALSGLVVVTSNNPAIKEFLSDKIDTYADTEDYKNYADIIEKLYYNPNLFKQYSEICHKSVFEKCNYDKTLAEEIKLIKKEYNSKAKNSSNINNNNNLLLSIIIPSYNVEEYLGICVNSIMNIKIFDKIEIIIVNDGSNDNTLNVAKELQKKFNYIKKRPIKIIDKENGGHGSTINKGLEVATGKYFKIIDSDDWVNSEDLEKLIEILEDENSDILITDYSEDLVDLNIFNEKEIYDFMIIGKQYDFEDLCYKNYGFNEWGPILATGNYRTEMLKETNFKITEKCSYVDMEFNCYSIINAKTITYYNLNIYRYFIGRSDQTVSKQSFINKYLQHQNIIFNIINIYENNSQLSNLKKNYILEKIIMPMVNSHYIILSEYLKSGIEFNKFDNKLKKYKDIYYHHIVNTKFIRLNRKTKGLLIKFTFILKKVNNIIKKVRKS